MKSLNNERTDDAQQPTSPWVHRLAILLIVLTWPLITIGSLVTTYDAGMAVPDWPNTYGYNMFLYPWTTWIFGPFDLFIEHGHRLLASFIGLVTIGMLIAAYRSKQRPTVVRLCWVALAGVIFQGVLGGVRVVLDERSVAMAHGCVGPAFFVLCWIIAGVTSRWWNATRTTNVSPGMVRFAAILAGTSYVQLILGAQLRHVPVDATPTFFRHVVELHVCGALVVLVLTVVQARKLARCGDLTLGRVGWGLLGLVVLQWSLGLGTWLVNYGWLGSLDWWPSLARYVIVAKGWYESIIVTGHVATGSMILAVACWIWLRLSQGQNTADTVTIAGLTDESNEQKPEQAFG